MIPIRILWKSHRDEVAFGRDVRSILGRCGFQWRIDAIFHAPTFRLSESKFTPTK